MKNTKIFLLLCLSAVFSYGCAGKIGIKKESQYMVNDQDTLFLVTSNMGCTMVDGAIYNALDKRYIANKNGITIEHEEDFWGNPQMKTFQMISLFQTTQLPGTSIQANAINAAKTWDYSINDTYKLDAVRYFISALMPCAIEKAEYTAYTEALNSKKGIVNITTRNPNKTKSDVRSTLYLLNGIEITEKIFDAINPVYIKYLSRITDKAELLQYNKKKLKEVVKVETFTYDEIIAPTVIIQADGGHVEIFLIDDIRLDEKSFQAIDKRFFKEYRRIYNNEKAFMPYLKKYPDARQIKIGMID